MSRNRSSGDNTMGRIPTATVRLATIRVATVPVAVGRFIRLRTDGAVAEVACTVTDAWQRRGMGTLLMQTLVTAARALGVTTFTATVLAENRPSLRLLHTAGRVTRRETDGCGTVDLDIELAGRGWR